MVRVGPESCRTSSERIRSLCSASNDDPACCSCVDESLRDLLDSRLALTGELVARDAKERRCLFVIRGEDVELGENEKEIGEFGGDAGRVDGFVA